MATMAAARSALRSTSARSAASKFASARSAASKFASAAKSSSSSSTPRSAFRTASPTNLLNSARIFRCPAELSACVETMQPFHTVTASALMTSMLSIASRSHAWVPDGI